jgi:hypothetical protein
MLGSPPMPASVVLVGPALESWTGVVNEAPAAPEARTSEAAAAAASVVIAEARFVNRM